MDEKVGRYDVSSKAVPWKKGTDPALHAGVQMMTDHSKIQEKLVMEEGLFLLRDVLTRHEVSKKWPPKGIGFWWRQSLMRDALTRAWGFKEVTTKEEWFVVKAVLGERYTYRTWSFFLVKAAFDQRCTYQGIMFKRWSPKGNGFWWRRSLMRGALTRAWGFKEVTTKEEWFVVKAVFGERYTYKDLNFFLVEAAFDERCTYQGMMCQGHHQRGVVSGEDSLWWEVLLQGHNVLKVITKGEWFVVKTMFDEIERCTSKSWGFKEGDHQRGVVSGEGSLWWEAILQGLGVSKKWPPNKSGLWWRQSLVRGTLTRTWSLFVCSGESSLWWEVHLQGHDALKMITKGECFLVKAAFDERCTYKDMMF